MMTCGKCVKYVEVIVNVWRNKHPVDVYRLIFDFASLCPTYYIKVATPTVTTPAKAEEVTSTAHF